MRLSLFQLAANAIRLHTAAAPRVLSTQLAEHVDRFASLNPTTLTLQNFVTFGTNKSSASSSFSFLIKELPVRFANIMKEFQLLPEQLYCTPSVQAVEDWYEQSFHDILQFKEIDPEAPETLDKFKTSLATILNRHSTVVETMAQGVLEMKEVEDSLESSRHIQRCIQYFLDRFYINRIGLRMLINQHLLLFTDLKKDGNHIGAIDQKCDVQEIAEDAYINARFLCEEYYQAAPEVEFECRNPYKKKSEGDRITMTYVPTHMYHMLFEILKNSLRAVVESHQGRSNDLPKVKVLICKGHREVGIKVSDQGGGIRRSDIAKLFNYTYSTAPRPEQHNSTPLAGYGYGLPLSYLYARYFNGDLTLNSVDGHGTDAMLTLKFFPSDASEVLPVYNKTSLDKYTKEVHNHDWSDSKHGHGVGQSRSTVGY